MSSNTARPDRKSEAILGISGPDPHPPSAESLLVIGLLSSRLSGELRQPLGVIRNALYFLDIHLGTTTDDKARRHLGIMLREIESVATIVSNLASLTSVQPTKRDPSDVEVIDTGCGMTTETQARVFEPLFTTSPQQTGLGMTVVRTLVGANGGKVELGSTPGKGTTAKPHFRKH